jgi:hypothetical protein
MAMQLLTVTINCCNRDAMCWCIFANRQLMSLICNYIVIIGRRRDKICCAKRHQLRGRGANWWASVLALCGGRRWDEVPCLVLAAVEELMADAAKSAWYHSSGAWHGNAVLLWLISAVVGERAAAAVEVETTTWFRWWCGCLFCDGSVDGKKDMGVIYWLSLDYLLAFQLVSYVTLSDTSVLFEPSKIPRFQTWYLDLDLRHSFTWGSVLQMKNTTLVSFPH